MKITISQEGANPVSIDTEALRSEEEYTPGKIYNAARVGITAAKNVAKHTKAIGAAALGIAANPVLMYFLTSIVGPSLAATIYNTIASIGTFKSGEDFLKSKQFMDKFMTKIKNKYDYFPKIDEVKKSTKAKTKSGFLAWILGGGQAAGDSVKSQMGTTKFLMKNINGVPVAVTQLIPVLGTMDFKQLFGKRVIIATGFILDTSGKIKSVPICRGYLKKGLLGKNEVNPNAVADSSYESGNVIMGYFSSESAGPVFTEDADEFIAMDDEYEDDECGDCIDDGEEMTW